MSETAAMSSRPRHTCRSLATFVAASVVLLSVAAPGPRRPRGPAQPDTLPAFKNPTGIAVGADGAVYISSQGDSSVVVYAPGARSLAKPVLRIGPGSGLVSPQGLALGRQGVLYVASGEHRSERKGSITVYAPGATGDVAPIRMIAGENTELSAPAALATGPGGKLYVVNGPSKSTYNLNGMLASLGNQVLVFPARAHGDAAPEKGLLQLDSTPRAPPPLRLGLISPQRLDSACRKPPQTSGSFICQFVERAQQEIASRPQPPDTARPIDVAIGTRGELLVLTTKGVSAYGDSVASLRMTTAAPGTQRLAYMGGGMLDRSHLATGPRGELYVSRRTEPKRGGVLGDVLGMKPGDTSGKKTSKPSAEQTLADFKSRMESMRGSMVGYPFISVYGPRETGNIDSLRTIAGPHTRLDQIADLVAGRDGSLYVLTGARIAVFPPDADGDAAPARIIEGPHTELRGSTSLALDRDGRIYVANNRIDDDRVFGAATVTVYAADAEGDASPTRTISGWSTLLRRPSSIAVDDDGTINVLNYDTYTDDYGSVRAYRTRGSDRGTQVGTLIGRATGIAGPEGIALDAGDTLYVRSGRVSRVTVYPPAADGKVAPARSLEGRATGLWGARPMPYDPELSSQMTIDAAGYLYVADPAQASGLNAYGPDLGAVRVYRPGAGGDEAPVRAIIGGYTKLNGPGGLAIDRQGRLYVPNRYGTGPGSITVYGPDADGDVHPVRMIAGSATGLRAPAAVALDAHDTLYVVNASSVTVYAPNARGDASPVRTIVAR